MRSSGLSRPTSPHHGARPVQEVAASALPGFVHPEWASAFPWLVQGITARSTREGGWNLGLYSTASTPVEVMAAWRRLRERAGVARVVHARQVHGADVRFHGAGPPGLFLAEACDGHATAVPGVMLAVTVADCVPVFVVDPRRRAVAVLHSGWRGTASGIMGRGLRVLEAGAGSRRADLHVHLGPAICGDCYEVGPEVFRALGQPAPEAPAPLDLRAVLASQAVEWGVPAERVTASSRCTRCGAGAFYSHRGGDAARQAAYVAVRPSGARP